MKCKYFALIITVFVSSSFIACRETAGQVEKKPVDYVNPYIGNISHILVPTYPTVQLPNSMLRVYPRREIYTSDLLAGLPVIVPGHRGLSVFRIDPVNDVGNGLFEGLSYSNEKTTPYSYSVDLDEAEIHVDFAPSHRSAIYGLTFQQGNANIVLTTGNGEIQTDDGELYAYQTISNGAKVYLYMETERSPVKTEIRKTPSRQTGWTDAVVSAGGDELTSVILSFDTTAVKLRYGISYISSEQAKKNLLAEIKDYNIEKLAETGRAEWNRVLGKVEVDGCDEDAKTVFYTALWRTYERMVNISEDSQYYSGMDKQIHSDEGTTFFTDDWIWDTYLAVHPLRTILEPEMEQQMLRSFVRYAQQSTDGWLPTFPELHGDNHAMNGNHSVITFLDAYNKGLRNFDVEGAYQAAKKTLNEKSIIPWRRVPHTELDVIYKEKGYFPALAPDEKETIPQVDGFEKRQSVAVTLAACYDTWALAQLAKSLGKEDDYNYFTQESFKYRNIYNEQTGFFHPKNKDGRFIEPFDYVFSGGPGNRDYYDENNGWVYRWNAQHNITDLKQLMGGDADFVANLDRTFREPLGKGRSSFYAQNADHTGNVGQFSMANEPCMHIPYLYVYAGQAWKTQKRVRTLLNQWFRNDLMGVPGDEDGGGLSSFVVFSSLGFYPVTSGLPMYVIGSPVFEKATIQVGDGKTFTVQCENYSPENYYIQSAKLNGKEWNKSWFTHDELMQGGVLELTMGSLPNKKWASDTTSQPPSYEMIEK